MEKNITKTFENNNVIQENNFGPQFVSPVGSQMLPLGLIFNPKGTQSGVPPTGGTLLKPTWARPAAQNAPDCVSIDPGVVLGVVVGLILEQFGFDFGAI